MYVFNKSNKKRTIKDTIWHLNEGFGSLFSINLNILCFIGYLVIL